MVVGALARAWVAPAPALWVGVAVLVGWNDCALSVAGRCGVLPHPAMKEIIKTPMTARQIRCIRPDFPCEKGYPRHRPRARRMQPSPTVFIGRTGCCGKTGGSVIVGQPPAWFTGSRERHGSRRSHPCT